MPRRTPLTSALAAVACVALLAGAAAPAVSVTVAPRTSPAPTVEPTVAMAPEPDDVIPADPLQLQIEDLTPTVVTTARDVIIAGTVTNASDETWTGINIAPFRSSFPITDSATLSAANELPVDSFVGERLVAVEAFDTVESLAPGESARFTTLIPEGQLSSAPGVYWVGVHASGQTETQPRDSFTDGRARTFLPVSPKAVRPLSAAVVIPLRATVKHTPDGRIDNQKSWSRWLGPGGRLTTLLAVAEESDQRSVSWLVDPAVPHAVSRLAAGNPGFSLDPLQTEGKEGEGKEPDPLRPVLPTPLPDGEEVDAQEPEDQDSVDPELVALASSWLTRFSEVFAGDEVLALPYGDLDVSALIETAPESVAEAHQRSAEVLTALGVESRPTLSSLDGFLSPAAVSSAPDSALVLLSEQALADDAAPVPRTGTLMGQSFAAYSGGIAQGGPGPESPGTAIAVRQRTASEAVLRGLAGDTSPLVISAPSDWEVASGAAELFDLMDTPRFQLQSLPTLVEESPDVVSPDLLVYTHVQREDEIPITQVDAAAALVARGQSFESVLTQPAGLDIQVRDVAWVDVGLETRQHPGQTLDLIRDTQTHFDDQLAQITVTGPALATMSGDSGNIGATVINDLSVPVTVYVEVDSSADLEVSVPNPISLSPESRRRLLLPTKVSREGVQTLTLRVADAEGNSLGDSTTVPIRASQVGGLLWLIMGGGALILFGAIGVRLFRRGLASRRDQGVA